MRKFPSLATAAVLAASLCGAESTMAGTFNFSGTFTQDTDVQFFSFALNSASHVSISTSSYASGGFFPQVMLWDGAGVNAGVPSGFSFPTPSSDYTMDYDFTGYSPIPATFYMAVVVFDRGLNPTYPGGGSTPLGDLPGGLPDASIFDPGFSTSVRFGCDVGNFWDGGLCNARNGSWALEISGADVTAASLYPPPSAVPEPASLALFSLAGLIPLMRRRLA